GCPCFLTVQESMATNITINSLDIHESFILILNSLLYHRNTHSIHLFKNTFSESCPNQPGILSGSHPLTPILSP
ncbi:MAG TPA: hypothetical protein VFI33_06645, partial [Puia sp.]|nr:hypothetical protein [Puia sp.]